MSASAVRALRCRVVVVEGPEVRPLLARTHDPLWSFSWGRSGTSARELAWAVLYDSARDPGLADDWRSAFSAEVVSLLPRDTFRIASHEVLAWLWDERLTARPIVCFATSYCRHRRQWCYERPEAVDVDLYGIAVP